MFRADLHCHTNCSDGSYSPEELIEMAKSIGLSGLSITDHDTISAYPNAIKAAKKHQLLLGTGVEFSTVFQNLNIHVLGYDFDLENPELKQFCENHQNRRKERNRHMLEKLMKHQMPITEEELETKTTFKSPGRVHIAQLMVEKGYVPHMQAAFDLYLGDGKSCYDSGKRFSLDETLEIIHQAKGKAFLAHPHLLVRRRLIRELLQKPFNGIECYYSRCHPVTEQKWIDIAQEKNWLVSGGSDFHGKNRPHVPLGCSWVSENAFFKIFQNHLYQ